MSLKSYFFEEDHTTTTAPVVKEETPTVQQPAAPHTAEIEVPDDDLHTRLIAKSDFTTALIFRAIQKYLAPLEGMALDDKVKFGIALKQAQAQDHIDPNEVLAAFDTALASLESYGQNFAQNLQTRLEDLVNSKTKKADELQAQATAMREEAFQAGQRLQTSQHKFDVAMQARVNEVTQERAKYASLLA